MLPPLNTFDLSRFALCLIPLRRSRGPLPVSSPPPVWLFFERFFLFACICFLKVCSFKISIPPPSNPSFPFRSVQSKTSFHSFQVSQMGVCWSRLLSVFFSANLQPSDVPPFFQPSSHVPPPKVLFSSIRNVEKTLTLFRLFLRDYSTGSLTLFDHPPPPWSGSHEVPTNPRQHPPHPPRLLNENRPPPPATHLHIDLVPANNAVSYFPPLFFLPPPGSIPLSPQLSFFNVKPLPTPFSED